MLSDQDRDPEMSMEEILTSIRRYVNTETDDANKINNNNKAVNIPDEPKLTLIDTHIPPATILHQPVLQEEHTLEPVSPFEKLEEIVSLDKNKEPKLNTSSINWDEFMTNIIRSMVKEWLDEKMLSIVEKMVSEEIAEIRRR